MSLSQSKFGPQLLFYGLLVALFFLSFRLEIKPEADLIEPEVTIIEPVAAETTPDFSSILNVQLKKDTFFEFLKPHIDYENAKITVLRQRLQGIHEKLEFQGRPNDIEKDLLTQLSEEYRINRSTNDTKHLIKQLLIRIDILPSSLVLSQSANESAWGTSRFAREGNNFFGQWCYIKGCGIIPTRRAEDLQHEVKRFPSVAESVHAYFMNINSFSSYDSLRAIREQLRAEGKTIDGISLSEGLGEYSARGTAYIYELQSMMYSNNLLPLDEV